MPEAFETSPRKDHTRSRTRRGLKPTAPHTKSATRTEECAESRMDFVCGARGFNPGRAGGCTDAIFTWTCLVRWGCSPLPAGLVESARPLPRGMSHEVTYASEPCRLRSRSVFHRPCAGDGRVRQH